MTEEDLFKKFEEISSAAEAIFKRLSETNKTATEDQIALVKKFTEAVESYTNKYPQLGQHLGKFQEDLKKFSDANNINISGLGDTFKALTNRIDELNVDKKIRELLDKLDEGTSTWKEKIKSIPESLVRDFGDLFNSIVNITYQINKFGTSIEALTRTGAGIELATPPEHLPYADVAKYGEWMLEIAKKAPLLLEGVSASGKEAEKSLVHSREALAYYTLSGDEANKTIVQIASGLTNLRGTSTAFYENFNDTLGKQMALYSEVSKLSREYNLNQLEMISTLTGAATKFKDVSQSNRELEYTMAITDMVAGQFNLTATQTQDLFKKLSEGLSNISMTSYGALTYLATGALPTTGVAQTGGEIAKEFVVAFQRILPQLPTGGAYGEYISQVAVQQLAGTFGVNLTAQQAVEFEKALRRGAVDEISQRINDLKKSGIDELITHTKEGVGVLKAQIEPLKQIANTMQTIVAPALGEVIAALPYLAGAQLLSALFPAGRTVSLIKGVLAAGTAIGGYELGRIKAEEASKLGG